MKLHAVILVAICASPCVGCTSTNGSLETNNRFSFPNSNVETLDNGNISVEGEKRTLFIWEDPPQREMYDELLTKALKQADGNMLINLKWATETTVYPFPVPIYQVKTRLEGVVVRSDLINKNIYGAK